MELEFVLAPQKDWEGNEPAKLKKVLKVIRKYSKKNWRKCSRYDCPWRSCWT